MLKGKKSNYNNNERTLVKDHIHSNKGGAHGRQCWTGLRLWQAERKEREVRQADTKNRHKVKFKDSRSQVLSLCGLQPSGEE